jgi:hypothetical protein
MGDLHPGHGAQQAGRRKMISALTETPGLLDAAGAWAAQAGDVQ